MKNDELMLMAYVDGALNRAGRRLVEQRLNLDAELRTKLNRLQQTSQLAKLSVARHSDDEVNHRTVGLLLNAVRSGRASKSPISACAYGLPALLLGIVLGAIVALGIAAVRGDLRSVQILDRVMGGYWS